MELERLGSRSIGALPERWTAEATRAWDSVLNLSEYPEAVADMPRTLRELRRRDVDSWLRLRLEYIGVLEHVGGTRLETERRLLSEESREFGELAVDRAART